MSVTHSADLMCCCIIDGGLIDDAVEALAEELQDSAWAVVNDNSIQAGSIDSPATALYLGVHFATGNTDKFGEEVEPLNMTRVLDELGQSVAYHKAMTIIAIRQSAKLTEETAPEFQAFIDWLVEQLAKANSWGYRIIPYWG